MILSYHIAGFHNELPIFESLNYYNPYFWFAAEDDGLFNDPFENSLDWCCFLLFSQTELCCCFCCWCCCCLWSCWSSTSSRPLPFDRREYRLLGRRVNWKFYQRNEACYILYFFANTTCIGISIIVKQRYLMLSIH